MAYRVIKFEPTIVRRGNFSQRVVLDGREYLFTFRWNQRESRWYFSLADSAESPILSGVKVVLNFPLITNRIRDERRPPGDLMAIDASGTGDDPGLTDLGERVRLLYVTDESVPRAAVPSEAPFEFGNFVASQLLAANANIGDTTVRPVSLTDLDTGFPWRGIVGHLFHEYEGVVAIGKLTGPDRIVLAEPLVGAYTSGGGRSILRGDGPI